MESLYQFLLQQSRERFDSTLRLVEALSEEEAILDRRPDWPTHEYHVGQDGSIAGIIHHLTAWRDSYCELLRGDNMDPAAINAPSPGWNGLLGWLRFTANDWITQVESIPGADIEVPIHIDGVSAGLTPLKMMWDMLEHEIEHSAQIAYLIERSKTD